MCSTLAASSKCDRFGYLCCVTAKHVGISSQPITLTPPIFNLHLQVIYRPQTFRHSVHVSSPFFFRKFREVNQQFRDSRYSPPHLSQCIPENLYIHKIYPTLAPNKISFPSSSLDKMAFYTYLGFASANSQPTHMRQVPLTICFTFTIPTIHSYYHPSSPTREEQLSTPSKSPSSPSTGAFFRAFLTLLGNDSSHEDAVLHPLLFQLGHGVDFIG